jgi:50S ribosomal subunit-associated GTPase HflX
MIADREKKIKKELSEIKKHREVQRKTRKGVPLVAVVGYTNAGWKIPGKY